MHLCSCDSLGHSIHCSRDFLFLLKYFNFRFVGTSYGSWLFICICTFVKYLPSHFSYVWVFTTPWTVALRLLCPWGFSRQEYWSRLPRPAPEDLPNPGIEPASHVSCIDRWVLYHWRHQHCSFYSIFTELLLTYNNQIRWHHFCDAFQLIQVESITPKAHNYYPSSCFCVCLLCKTDIFL